MRACMRYIATLSLTRIAQKMPVLPAVRTHDVVLPIVPHKGLVVLLKAVQLQ